MCSSMRVIVRCVSCSVAVTLPILAGCQGTAPSESTAFGPVAVLIERFTDAEVIGAESPSWALYTDGTLIYRRWVGKEYDLYQVRLRASEFANCQETLEGAFRQSGECASYQVSKVGDEPTSELWFFGDQRIRRAVIYGGLRVEEEDGGDIRDEIDEQGLEDALRERAAEVAANASRLPREVLSAYTMMADYDSAQGVPWFPPRVELLLGEHVMAAGQPMPWPAGWPELLPSDLADTRGVRSLYVSGRRLGEVRRVKAALGVGGTLEVRGRQFTLDYRLPFPCEERWMRRGAEAETQ